MLRSTFARIWQVVFYLFVLGALATASLGGVAAQTIGEGQAVTPTNSVSSALATKPTRTPTRKPNKTKTPTPNTTATEEPAETLTATAIPTETDANAATLPPGVYHLNGAIRNIAKNVLTWQTPRGTFNLSLTKQSNLQLDGKRIAANALEKGQWLDGLVRVGDNGKMTALDFAARTPSQVTANGKTENSPIPEADTRTWSAPLDLDAGINTPQVPLLAAESASGSAVVWYADSPQPGLYFSVHIAEADTWTEPQFLAFTSAADYRRGWRWIINANCIWSGNTPIQTARKFAMPPRHSTL